MHDVDQVAKIAAETIELPDNEGIGGVAAGDGFDCAPVDTPLPASAACATDPAATTAVASAIWCNIFIAASSLDVS
jgi:hypothetical protein